MLAGNQETKIINNKTEMDRNPPLIPQLFIAIEEHIRQIQNYEMLCGKAKRLKGGQLR